VRLVLVSIPLMLRRAHFIVGIMAVVAFLLTGQLMGHHYPNIKQLPAKLRMMYVSRHIYLLAAALVNVALGLYFQPHQSSWRRALQTVGSLLIPDFLSLPYHWPSWQSCLSFWPGAVGEAIGLTSLFAGVMTHLVASAGARRIDTSGQRP
jgi:hypothetical protein